MSDSIVLPTPQPQSDEAVPPPPSLDKMPPAGLIHDGVVRTDPYARVHFNAKDPIPKNRVTDYSFEWWFNYFYNECHPGIREIVYREWLNPDGTLRYLDKSNDHKRDVLTRMLEDGFVAYGMLPDRYEGNDDVILPRMGGVKVEFRGDSRTPFQVKGQNGTSARARVPALRLEEHMDSDWHPYSRIPQTKMYFRRGQQDACLQTVVSVAPMFSDATKFPPVNEMKASDRRTASVELVGWRPPAVQNDIRARAQKFGSPNLNLPSLIATRTYVYVVRVDRAFNTEAVQEDIVRSVPPHHGITLSSGVDFYENAQASGFRERAVGEIPWNHHLACFMVDRVHYGDNFNDGHLIIVRKWRWLQTDQQRTHVLGDHANRAQAAALQHAFDGIQQQGTPDRQTGLTQLVCLPHGVVPRVQIQKVREIDLVPEWN